MPSVYPYVVVYPCPPLSTFWLSWLSLVSPIHVLLTGLNQPDGHLARVLLLEQYARPIQTSFNRLTSFGSYLKQAEARFNFDHSTQIPAFKRSLRSRSLSMQIDQLRNCEYSQILRNVSIQPSPCSYIKLDQRPIAILRARLRLNRNHLNYTKFRCKMSLSPLCPSCPHSAETVRHVLFHCPTFAAVRHICFNTLAAFECPISFEVLTGDVSSIPPRLRPLALAASAKLLLTINLHRPI